MHCSAQLALSLSEMVAIVSHDAFLLMSDGGRFAGGARSTCERSEPQPVAQESRTSAAVPNICCCPSAICLGTCSTCALHASHTHTHAHTHTHTHTSTHEHTHLLPIRHPPRYVLLKRCYSSIFLEGLEFVGYISLSLPPSLPPSINPPPPLLSLSRAHTHTHTHTYTHAHSLTHSLYLSRTHIHLSA